MTKKFFISKAEKGSSNAPDFDRFQRIDMLNKLLEVGWEIKGMVNETDGTYFMLEKSM